MGVRIYCDSKEILDAKNTIFGSLHESIISIIEDEKLKINSTLEAMLEKMDQRVYGIGAIWVDIADYLKTKEEVLFFADLVKRGIEKEHKQYPFIPPILDSLWNFHIELLKYREKLK